VRGWQRSHANERTIQALWTAWPSANVGLVTGEPARLVVLDIDGVEGRRSLRALEEMHGALPETLTSATGGGGEQRLIWLCDRYPPGARRVGELCGLVPLRQGRVRELW